MPVTLVARTLSCRRGARQLFCDLDIALSGGQALQVTGANGVGKSSLLEMLCGMRRDDGATVMLEGIPIGEAGRRLHYIGHQNGVTQNLTVGQNIAFWTALLDDAPRARGRKGRSRNRRSRDRRISDAFAALRLDPALGPVRAGDLSRGQRQRLALMRLVLAPRPLWLLDEPAAGLDRNGHALMQQIIASHRAGGGLVVITTHAVDTAIPESHILALPVPSGTAHMQAV